MGAGIARLQGLQSWGHQGVAVKLMGLTPATLYTGEIFDSNIAPVVPKAEEYGTALWCFFRSGEFAKLIRQANTKIGIAEGSVVRVAFEAARWHQAAREEYPHGLPEPYSDDPTQWIFHGHPCGSVVWGPGTRRTRVGSLRADATVLQVAVARLLGYRWPAERDPDMRLAEEARTWAGRSADLAEFADADGIVCLSSVGGEPAAADRLRRLLAAAYGGDWSFATERELLVAAADDDRPVETIEAWLCDRFFEAHCQLFQQRPFVWHVWDGRPDGFHALVNYHRLAGADGEGRRTLDALTYRNLGDWIRAPEIRPGPGRGRRGWPARGGAGPAESAREDHDRRAPVRPLRPLEAARRAADRLGAGHQRRRPHQHPPVHVGRAHAGWQGGRRCPPRQAEDRLEQGPGQGSAQAP